MPEMQQNEESRVLAIKNFLKEILDLLKISSFSDEKIENQAIRIVYNKTKLTKSISNLKPKFVDKNAKLLFYLSEISARLSDKDSVIALICIRLNDEYEKVFNERLKPSINLRDPKIQKFLKFILKYFSPQLGGTSDVNSLNISTPSSSAKSEKNKIEESKNHNDGLLYEAFLNLEKWSKRSTDISKLFGNNDRVKKKYMKT